MEKSASLQGLTLLGGVRLEHLGIIPLLLRVGLELEQQVAPLEGLLGLQGPEEKGGSCLKLGSKLRRWKGSWALQREARVGRAERLASLQGQGRKKKKGKKGSIPLSEPSRGTQQLGKGAGVGRR